MIKLKRVAPVALMMAGLALGSSAMAASSQASPALSTINNAKASGAPAIQLVARNDHRRGHHSKSWRRRHWEGNRHYYGRDWNPGAYIALGLIGALVDSGMSESHARSAMQRCDDRFRSFEWDTGLYTTYGGEKRLCPYLR